MEFDKSKHQNNSVNNPASISQEGSKSVSAKEEDEENLNLLEESKEVNTKRPKWMVKMEKILENYAIVGLMSAITIYSLFFDDIRMISTTIDSDYIVFAITSWCFGMFCLEIILASICKENYFLTFFFWLDVVSTLSMLTDIG